jgi:NhaP-type Na+/H+ or K+/H+ antiporter
VLLATGEFASDGWVGWLRNELLYKLAAGLVCGVLLGKLLAWVFFRLPKLVQGAGVRDGLWRFAQRCWYMD